MDQCDESMDEKSSSECDVSMTKNTETVGQHDVNID